MIRTTLYKTSVLFLGASLCTVGCGSDGGSGDSSSSPVTDTQTSTASETPSSTPTTSPTSEDTPLTETQTSTVSEIPSSTPTTSPTSEDTPLAVGEHESGGVEVALIEVKRASGDTLNVRWRYHNGTQEEQTLFEGNSSWYTKYRLAADTYILDLVNQKKHLVLTADGNPITSQTTHDYGTLTLDPDGTINVWAKYPAPPSTVETLSVYISGVLPFEDIPISD